MCTAVAIAAGCGDDASSADAAAADGATADAEWFHGCPSLVDPLAQPGDPIDGDTFETFAMEFFATWCTRCHSAALTTPQERNGAPPNYNWDVEASVREHLAEIRYAVGVINFMPINPPDPTCEERARIVRWIDADAP